VQIILALTDSKSRDYMGANASDAYGSERLQVQVCSKGTYINIRNSRSLQYWFNGQNSIPPSLPPPPPTNGATAPSGTNRASSLSRLHDHTQTQHTR